ncbi:hypothetical protein [Streptomyces roseochromogenus]|uniref:Uncharacterized protein n=1 Tax=Streptomyces roseochromogenus subsp. oscitans DS 12.976 TaxID=1352936 RepID=V6JIQ0_STRRC|nr:hypothetical protein [Streptomyces roseochromogenus]EST19036.1 hypothetical protein M878_42995 [Streptomyces roseochromogenus subsp. oscitans DS 12.976]
MEILLLRTALAPSLVLLVSVVARRSGPRRGGLLLGAPTTSGPFLALMWLNGGSEAASRAAHGNVAAQLIVAAFCLVYGRLAPVLRPARTLTAALVCAAGAGLLAAMCANVWLTAALGLAVIFAGLRTWPAPAHTDRPPDHARRWDIPVRMAVSATTVLLAVHATEALGSFTGGIFSALPVLLAVMALSTHRSTGAAAAAAMMRAALTATPCTLGFLLMIYTALAASVTRS